MGAGVGHAHEGTVRWLGGLDGGFCGGPQQQLRVRQVRPQKCPMAKDWQVETVQDWGRQVPGRLRVPETTMLGHTTP